MYILDFTFYLASLSCLAADVLMLDEECLGAE